MQYCAVSLHGLAAHLSASENWHSRVLSSPAPQRPRRLKLSRTLKENLSLSFFQAQKSKYRKMKALAAGQFLFNLLAITEKLYRVVQVVRRGQDPMRDDLYIRLNVEKARYAEWKKRMGIDTIEDAKRLMGKLTPETRVSLTEILDSDAEVH